MPSGKFGAKAMWWHLSIISANLTTVIRRLMLGSAWKWARMKRLRAALLNIPAKIVRSGRKTTLKFASATGRLLNQAVRRLTPQVLLL